MSVETAKRFLNQLALDVELRRRIAEAENGDARVAVAVSAGCVFTRDEFETACGDYDAARTMSPEEAEVLGFAAFRVLGAAAPAAVPPYGPAVFYSATRLR
jgi:predicted ribosomally synthesized peptide with nif11-like leader